MREIINILDQLNENALTASTLVSGHNGTKYLEILVAKMAAGDPLEVDPKYRPDYGDKVYATPETVKMFKDALANIKTVIKSSGKLPPKVNLPKFTVVGADKKTSYTITTGALFKSPDYTGRANATGGTTKDYNAGHLNELIVGLACTAKFLNQGNPITKEQLIAMTKHSNTQETPKGIYFSLDRMVTYPDQKLKADRVNMSALIPTVSALSFIRQMNANALAADIQALFAGAIKYANESVTVKNACDAARMDPNNNLIEVISDGTSDSAGTKADITLKIDGDDPNKVKQNLLSLKTSASDTLGQISGLKFENVSLWFRTNFNIDITKYKEQFDPKLDKETVYNNLLKLYDDVIYPQVQKLVDDQTPQKEAEIVKQFAKAANFYARGEKLEDVEIVKLDDKTLEGNYKILRFSDSLYDAMRYLDLETRLVGQGGSRTIQIWVKPAEGVKVPKGSNRLCQFRTTRTGGYARNYFESGPMLEALTQVKIEPTVSESTIRPSRTISPPDIFGRPRR
jgi:hypothetical protein